MPPGYSAPDAGWCDSTLIFIICGRRDRFERFINRLKNSCRGASRYHHTISGFLSFAMLASIRQRINFALPGYGLLAGR